MTYFQLLPPWSTRIHQPTLRRVSWTSRTASTRATRASRNSRISTASRESSTAANTAESYSRTARSISFTTGSIRTTPTRLNVLYVGCRVATGSSSTAILSVTSSKWGKKALLLLKVCCRMGSIVCQELGLFFTLNDSDFFVQMRTNICPNVYFFSYYFFKVPIFESYKCCWRFVF